MTSMTSCPIQLESPENIINIRYQPSVDIGGDNQPLGALGGNGLREAMTFAIQILRGSWHEPTLGTRPKGLPSGKTPAWELPSTRADLWK